MKEIFKLEGDYIVKKPGSRLDFSDSIIKGIGSARCHSLSQDFIANALAVVLNYGITYGVVVGETVEYWLEFANKIMIQLNDSVRNLRPGSISWNASVSYSFDVTAWKYYHNGRVISDRQRGI